MTVIPHDPISVTGWERSSIRKKRNRKVATLARGISTWTRDRSSQNSCESIVTTTMYPKKGERYLLLRPSTKDWFLARTVATTPLSEGDAAAYNIWHEVAIKPAKKT